MTYFVATSGDGGTSIRQVSAERLKLELERGDFNGRPFLDSIPENDNGCWRNVPENAVLFIKGDIVSPKPVQVVQKYELP